MESQAKTSDADTDFEKQYAVAQAEFASKLAALGDKRGEYIVQLASAGNIDFGQDPRRSMPGVPKKRLRVATLKNASLACRLYITHYELGGGNWIGGEVTHAKSKKLTAYVSYNGRVWNPTVNPMAEIAL
jgi:hypothetical protein